MSGIDFIDASGQKYRQRYQHSQGIFESMKWAGKDFKANQETKLRKMKGMKIESSKGTSKIDLGKMYRTQIIDLDGRYISTKKGTELLKL